MDSIIRIDGRPLEKLIEVVSNGIGTLYRPRAIRKEADAKAYEIKTLEKAKMEALADGRIIDADNLDRLNERLIGKEIKRQNNLDDIIEIAALQLQGNNAVTDESVNEDWTTRFFGIAQDVSDEEMQNLWGRILAGEIKQPKSFSLRTLDLLRNLTKEEAELFIKVSPYILGHYDCFVFTSAKGDLREYGVSYSEIAKLTEIGLMQPGALVQKNLLPNENIESQKSIIYQNIIILITMAPKSPKISIPISKLTRSGEELYSLLLPSFNMDYIKGLSEFIKKKNSTAKVQYGYINYIDDEGKVSCKLPLVDM